MTLHFPYVLFVEDNETSVLKIWMRQFSVVYWNSWTIKQQIQQHANGEKWLDPFGQLEWITADVARLLLYKIADRNSNKLYLIDVRVRTPYTCT